MWNKTNLLDMHVAVNGGLIWPLLVIFLSQFAGYVKAVSICQGQTGQVQCTDPASPKCCYGTCCPESDFSKFPFSKCTPSSLLPSVQTCLEYPKTACCPNFVSLYEVGQSCCKPHTTQTYTTYTSCPGISKTECCTEKRKTACCYTRCCGYFEYFSFPFSECTGTRGTPARYTTETCLTYPNTQCCTLTHATGTKSSSVFCCSSRYLTDFMTYSSCLLLTTSSGCYDPDDRTCSWTTSTDYCTRSNVDKCCAYGCCISPSFSKCGMWYPWSTYVCSDYRSPSCCNVESKGNIVGQTCCHPTSVNGNTNPGNDENMSTIVGWSLGVSVMVLVFIAVLSAHIIVRKRRARNWMTPTTMELTDTATATPPLSRSSMDQPPPSYETVREQPPQYDYVIDNDQPPPYNDAVNPTFSLPENNSNTKDNQSNG